MPKDIGGLSGPLLIIQQAQPVCGRERVSGRNNILKAMAGTSWGQQKETLLITYKAVDRSIINYAAPVYSPNLHDTNYRKIQYTQNEALRIATGCHKMSSIDHLQTEAEMLKVKEHSELLSPQYLARCLLPGNACHPITTSAIPERQMKETLYTRHRNTVEPMMVKMIGNLHSKHSTLQQSLKLFSVREECGARWSASAYKQLWKGMYQKGTLNPRATKIRIL